MARETRPDLNVESRAYTWKRRLKVGDLAIGIALIAVDLAVLRASGRNPYFALIPLLGLLALMVGFVWRYVPGRWDRPGYVAALVMYLVFLGFYLASWNPVIADVLARLVGIE